LTPVYTCRAGASLEIKAVCISMNAGKKQNSTQTNELRRYGQPTYLDLALEAVDQQKKTGRKIVF